MPRGAQEFCHVLPHAVRLLLVSGCHVLAAACWAGLGAVGSRALLLGRVEYQKDGLAVLGLAAEVLLSKSRTCIGRSHFIAST